MSVQYTRPVIQVEDIKAANLEYLNARRLGAQNPHEGGDGCSYAYDDEFHYRCGVGAVLPIMALLAIKSGGDMQNTVSGISKYINWSQRTMVLADVTQKLHDNWQGSAYKLFQGETLHAGDNFGAGNWNTTDWLEAWKWETTPKQTEFIGKLLAAKAPITEPVYRDWIENYL